MNEKYKEIAGLSRNLVVYGLIGTFTSSLDFALFTLLNNYLGIHYCISNCFSVLLGITSSFVLNRRYNFKVKDKTKQRFVIFLCVGLFGLCLSNLILWFGIDVWKNDGMIVKFLSIIFVVGFQFLINKFITFSNRL